MENFAEQVLDQMFPVIGRERMGSTVTHLKTLPSTSLDKFGKLMRSNTTVLAFKYNGGIIMAGDRRMVSGGYTIQSEGETKITKLTEHSGIACAGSCSVIRYLVENMEAACQKFNRLTEQELSPDGQANYLKNLLEEWWYSLLILDYWAVGSPILAAYDTDLGKPRIFEFDESGFFYEPRVVTGTGCGFDAVERLIIDYKPTAIDQEAATALAVRAMFHSGKSSHGVSDAELILPSIAVIDPSGFKWIEEDKIKKSRDKIVLELGDGHE